MRTALKWTLVTVCALTFVTAVPVEFTASVAHAQAGEKAQWRALVADAKPWYEKAGPDYEPADRKKARKEAYKRLKQARAVMDAYLDAHPGEVESFDSEYCEISTMMFWIKKDASANEFRGDSKPVELPTVEPAGDEGGGGMTSKPREKPRDDPKPGDEPRPGEDPQPADDGPAPPDPNPTAPAAEPSPADQFAARATATWAAILDIERKNPGDVATLYEMYEKFLAEFSDPTLPEYILVVGRLGTIAERMKSIHSSSRS